MSELEGQGGRSVVEVYTHSSIAATGLEKPRGLKMKVETKGNRDRVVRNGTVLRACVCVRVKEKLILVTLCLI